MVAFQKPNFFDFSENVGGLVCVLQFFLFFLIGIDDAAELIKHYTTKAPPSFINLNYNTLHLIKNNNYNYIPRHLRIYILYSVKLVSIHPDCRLPRTTFRSDC